eukprot:scaffold4049_cov76-Cylindrotheca_fusiformis.AAC.7
MPLSRLKEDEDGSSYSKGFFRILVIHHSIILIIQHNTVDLNLTGNGIHKNTTRSMCVVAKAVKQARFEAFFTIVWVGTSRKQTLALNGRPHHCRFDKKKEWITILMELIWICQAKR